jgi:hypothetical protein
LSNRVDELVRLLGLGEHVEGGWFREQFRSRRMVRTDDGRSERWAGSSIYYLLRAGEVSRWHRVASDEVWHWYEGSPVELHLLDAQLTRHKMEILGAADTSSRPQRVAPAGCWQAARCTGEYALMGCTVSPGFEYSDFRLLSDMPLQAERVTREFPALTSFL